MADSEDSLPMDQSQFDLLLLQWRVREVEVVEGRVR